MNDSSPRVYINDVSPRDGLQIERRCLPTDDKIALIDGLSATGLAKVEVTSFVSPKAIPNLADAAEVVQRIRRVPGVDIVVLVPNLKGCERALAYPVDEINLVMSASESHSRANLRMTPEQSLAQFSEIIAMAGGRGIFINASLSTTFGCPFDGKVPEERVFGFIERLFELGVDGISLCDTTGMANPVQVARLCEAAVTRWPQRPFTLHVHNTRGMGLANCLAAWQSGIQHFDAALGGLGGCPFAPGASGNVCTEDLVHMFEEMGLTTGVDLDALLALAATLPERVGHEIPGQVVKAGRANRRYPCPAVHSRTGP